MCFCLLVGRVAGPNHTLLSSLPEILVHVVASCRGNAYEWIISSTLLPVTSIPSSTSTLWTTRCCSHGQWNYIASIPDT